MSLRSERERMLWAIIELHFSKFNEMQNAFFFQKMQHIRKSLVENRLSPCNRKNVLRLDKPRPCIKTITHEIAILTCTTLGRLFTFPCSYVRKSDPVCIYFSVIARLISAESNYTMPDPDIEVTITILTNSRDNAFIH